MLLYYVNHSTSFLKKCLFLRERERASEHVPAQVREEQRERETGDPKQPQCAVTAEPDMGFELTNCEIMT